MVLLKSNFRIMQSFTFSELDERGKSAAIDRYFHEMNDLIPAEMLLVFFDKEHVKNSLLKAMNKANWRFTEHGERIA